MCLRILSMLVVLIAGSVSSATKVMAQDTGATATGVSREFNPAISVNSLFLAGAARGDEVLPTSVETGMRLQESELQFTATVDPYTHANVIFAYEDGELRLEEGFVSSNVLSHGFGLRAGQMFVGFGRENPLHTHQLPFVQRSLFSARAFGEALSEFGLEVSYIAPLDWFLELRGAALNGDQDNVFAAPGDWDLAYLYGATALFDLSDHTDLTLQTDLLAGPNDASTSNDKRWSQLASAVARLKWVSPAANDFLEFDLLGEFQYLDRDNGAPPRHSILRGGYVYADVRFSRRWHVAARYDQLDANGAEHPTRRGSLVLAFVPTEFTALRFQVSSIDAPEDQFTEFMAQYNFTIGSHPAHKY